MIPTLLRRAAAVAAAAAVLIVPLAPAAPGAAEERPPVRDVEIDLTALDRGADVRVPHLEGRTVVDGEVRVRVRGSDPVLLGRSGNSYVVVLFSGRRWRVQRVTPGRAARTLATAVMGPTGAALSDDGRHFVVSRFVRARDTTVAARSARTGRLVGRTLVPGFAEVLAMTGHRVVLGGDRIGTRTWNAATGTSRRVSRDYGYAVDLVGDRLAVYSSVPEEYRCTRVVRLARPSEQLWRSCREYVDSFSPGCRRTATFAIRSGSIGPNRMWVRGSDGRPVARFHVKGRRSQFGPVAWESEFSVVAEVAVRRRTATVRCFAERCERASALGPAPAV